MSKIEITTPPSDPTSELRELVDHPNETLDCEYKSWLDLSTDNTARADLARHIAALANHGGGQLVFGFKDQDLTYAGPKPHLGTTFK
jgi:predicted HTH transcriptional regulator